MPPPASAAVAGEGAAKPQTAVRATSSASMSCTARQSGTADTIPATITRRMSTRSAASANTKRGGTSATGPSSNASPRAETSPEDPSPAGTAAPIARKTAQVTTNGTAAVRSMRRRLP